MEKTSWKKTSWAAARRRAGADQARVEALRLALEKAQTNSRITALSALVATGHGSLQHSASIEIGEAVALQAELAESQKKAEDSARIADLVVEVARDSLPDDEAGGPPDRDPIDCAHRLTGDILSAGRELIEITERKWQAAAVWAASHLEESTKISQMSAQISTLWASERQTVEFGTIDYNYLTHQHLPRRFVDAEQSASAERFGQLVTELEGDTLRVVRYAEAAQTAAKQARMYAKAQITALRRVHVTAGSIRCSALAVQHYRDAAAKTPK